jgi:hypothetical protein
MGPDAHRHSPLPRRLRGRHAARLGHLRALQDADAEREVSGVAGDWEEGEVKGRGKREQIYEAQRGACWLCRRLMLRSKLAPTYEERQAFITIDHVIPQSKGGKNVRSNLMGAHAWCNRVRGSLPPDLASKAIRARLDSPQGDVERFIAGLQWLAYRPTPPIPAWEQERKPSRGEMLVMLGKQRKAQLRGAS